MKYGLPAKTIDKICGVFARFPAIEKAVLYGSRAKGNYKPGSDIDLTLYGAALTSDMCATIADALDDLLLPYKVDLSIFDELDHAKLREHIERVGVVFYKRKKERTVGKGGWETRTLGELCDIVGGGTPPKNNPRNYSGDIAWATVRDMKSDIITDTEHKITKAAVAASATNIIPAGNVVIATRVGLGKVCLVEQPTAINQDLRGIVPRDPRSLSVRYLFWWLKSISHLIEKEGTGATVKGVKLPFVKSLSIPFPKITEQQRIVAILDEAFKGIATAKANAEKNLRNAREVFDNYLEQSFMQGKKGWFDAPLSELCEIKHGYAFDGANFSTSANAEWPILLTPGNFTESAKLAFNDRNTKYYTGADIPEAFRLNVGDLVVVMTDLSSKMKILGKPAFVNILGLLHNQRIGKVVFESKRVLGAFLYYYMRTLRYADAIKNTASGTMVRHTAPKRILDCLISFPSSNEQECILEKLRNLEAETRRMEACIHKKLIALDNLKKSLLHQAFNGEL